MYRKSPLFLILLFSTRIFLLCTETPLPIQEAIFAGLRRSSYGCEPKNRNDGWWADKAILLSKSISCKKKVIPVVIQIVSGFLSESGKTRFEFEKPASYTASTKNMTFKQPHNIDHDRALSVYDRKKVRVILQLESGNSDISNALEVVFKKFGHHPSVLGFGIDAEWYFYKESKNKTGIPISDVEAERWVQKVLSFGQEYTLFIKHWKPDNLPPTFRHKNLWFLSDSQDFNSMDDILTEFRKWGEHYKNSSVGFQFGYIRDKRWWKKIRYPGKIISEKIINNIPNVKYLFWVDFTASRIRF